jgi:hypothetical protein
LYWCEIYDPQARKQRKDERNAQEDSFAPNHVNLSYELIAISTTPRCRVPDRDMDTGERTPPRANDKESSAGFIVAAHLLRL